MSDGGGPARRSILFCQVFDSTSLGAALDQLVASPVLAACWGRLTYWGEAVFTGGSFDSSFPTGTATPVLIGRIALNLDVGTVPQTLDDFTITLDARGAKPRAGALTRPLGCPVEYPTALRGRVCLPSASSQSADSSPDRSVCRSLGRPRGPTLTRCNGRLSRTRLPPRSVPGPGGDPALARVPGHPVRQQGGCVDGFQRATSRTGVFLDPPGQPQRSRLAAR